MATLTTVLKVRQAGRSLVLLWPSESIETGSGARSIAKRSYCMIAMLGKRLPNLKRISQCRCNLGHKTVKNKAAKQLNKSERKSDQTS